MSYVDLLIKLRNDVESDIIPKHEKAKILAYIERLEALLWKYSD